MVFDLADLKTEIMSAKQILEKYILENPDFWEFEDSMKEVQRLKALCKNEDERKNAA